MQLPTARKIASKGIIDPTELSQYQSAKRQLRKARKRRRANRRMNRPS